MITDKDVADKKNEVKMLRLERDEMLIRQQLDRAKKDSDQHKQICEHCETIGALRSTIGELEERDTLKTTAIDALQNDLTQQIKTDELLHGRIGVLKAELSNSKSAIGMKNGVINEKNKTIDELTEQRDSEHETSKALRRVIDEIEQDATKYKTTIDELEAELRDEMQQKYVAIRLGAEKAATILRLNETISDLRMAGSDMLDTINECSRREADDSRVLMQVVEIVKEWGRLSAMVSTYDMRHLRDLLVDYLAAPEPSVVTLKTPSIGTWVGSKNEETHLIDEAKMAAVRMLVDSGDNWVVSTDMDAIEVMEQKETIDELKDFIRDQGGCVDDRDNRIEQLTVLNEALRVDIELAHNLSRDHIAGQDRIIEGLRSRMTGARVIIDNQATSIEELKSTVDFGQSRINLLVEKKSNCIGELMKDLDAKNTVIKDFKAIETKETDRLHTVIEGNGKIIDELNAMYCDACGKLERIEKIAGPSVRGRVCTRESVCRAINEIVAIVQKGNTIDEITKIIQEE